MGSIRDTDFRNPFFYTFSDIPSLSKGFTVISTENQTDSPRTSIVQ